jgi:hypothetical protein
MMPFRRPFARTTIRSLLLFLCVSACLASGTNSTLTDPAQAREASDQFMQALSRGDTAAFELVRRSWVNPADAARVAEDGERQWRSLEAVFRIDAGKRLHGAFEYLGTRRLGSSTAKFVYLLKYEHGALPWSLTFYKPGDDWRACAIALGDQARDDMLAMEVVTSAAPAALRQATDACMVELSRDRPSEAFAGLELLWCKPDEAAGAFAGLERRFRSGAALLEVQLGKRLPGGFEFAGTTALGRSFLQIIYVWKHEHGIFPWVFRFYKAQDTWHLVSVATGADVSPATLARLAAVEPAAQTKTPNSYQP